MISRDAPFFSRGGCKCTPLLQQKLGTVAFSPAPENRAHFQGRVVLSPTPEDAFSGGRKTTVPSSFCRSGVHLQPPLEKNGASLEIISVVVYANIFNDVQIGVSSTIHSQVPEAQGFQGGPQIKGLHLTTWLQERPCFCWDWSSYVVAD